MTLTAQARSRGAGRSRRSFRLGKPWLICIEIVVPVLLLAAWWIASAGSTNAFFPPLSTILQRFRELWLFEHLGTDILPSLGNLAAGFGIGGTVGILAGIALGMFRPLNWAVSPVVDFWRAIPPVAIVPIFVALFGFGTEVRIVTISISALFPTLISTLDGMRALDDQMEDVARSYRLSWWDRLIDVYLPAASPRIASGLQVSLQVSFVVMIASEMLGSSHGIGAMTLNAQQSFAIPDMWAGILLLGVVGYLANLIFNMVRDRVLRWYVLSQQAGKEQ